MSDGQGAATGEHERIEIPLVASIAIPFMQKLQKPGEFGIGADEVRTMIAKNAHIDISVGIIATVRTHLFL